MSAEQNGSGIAHQVAAPWRLDDTDIAIMPGTGDIFNFLDIVSATGATIRTVATLSIKAEIIPAKRDREMIAHLTFGILVIIISARSEGIFDSINSETIPIVPAIIIITFQSTEKKTLFSGMIPRITKSAAEVSAIYAL